jgi:hypothetical protein
MDRREGIRGGGIFVGEINWDAKVAAVLLLYNVTLLLKQLIMGRLA